MFVCRQWLTGRKRRAVERKRTFACKKPIAGGRRDALGRVIYWGSMPIIPEAIDRQQHD